MATPLIRHVSDRAITCRGSISTGFAGVPIRASVRTQMALDPSRLGANQGSGGGAPNAAERIRRGTRIPTAPPVGRHGRRSDDDETAKRAPDVVPPECASRNVQVEAFARVPSSP